MSKKKLLTAVFIGITAGIAYYAISPLFNNTTVDEALPEEFTSQDLSSEETIDDPEPMTMDVSSEPYPVVGTSGHPASGNVIILSGKTSNIARFEDFSTINGPNLHLYLAKDLEAIDFIDLGPIKATNGNINYSLPTDVNLAEYPYLLHWCVPFGVLFNYAELR